MLLVALAGIQFSAILGRAAALSWFYGRSTTCCRFCAALPFFCANSNSCSCLLPAFPNVFYVYNGNRSKKKLWRFQRVDKEQWKARLSISLMFSPLISGPWGGFQFPTLCGILLHDLASFHSLSTQLFAILLMSYNSKTLL